MRSSDTNKIRSVSGIRNVLCSLWIISLMILCGTAGCIQTDQLRVARDYARAAQRLYERAVAKYRELIRRGESLEEAYFELGLLYYQQAEYDLASLYLSKTSLPQAGKYRALALYKNNDFTQARDAFKRVANPDSETLYYHGRVCEELNLYDQALDIYRRIEEEAFKRLAQNRIRLITRLGESLHLRDLPLKLQSMLNSAPPAERYPNAGALILLCDEVIELNPDNTATYYEHFLIKILNERGKQDFSEITIGYDSTYEKVELEYARTIRPDGVVVPVGSRHIRDVSKYLNFPLYSNARVRIISFPEITQGCVIEYKYKIHRNQLINDKDFVLSYQLQESEPIMRAEFRLVVPLDKTLHYKLLNLDYNKSQLKLEPLIEESSGHREYLWEFRDIPAIIPEANMPSNSKINPIILISTFDSWQEVYTWWWSLARDKIQADDAIRQKVKELTHDKQSIVDKARAIYNFCAEDIRYVAVEYGQAGYEPHKAADIFSNKYGDCKDQAMLLITMLREIGLEAYPVLIGTDDYLNLEEDFPSVSFNHCIAALRMAGELVFLDPTCSSCSFGNLPAADQDRRVLVFSDTGYEIKLTPLYSYQNNRLRHVLKMHINADETIRAEKEVHSYGLYDASQRFWLKYSSDEEISESLKQAIQGVSPAAVLLHYDIHNLDNLDKNIILSYSFAGREYWSRAGDLRIFPQLALLDTSIVAKQVRRYPLDLGLPSSNETELEVTLPSRFKLEHLPSNFQKKSPWLNLSVEYRFRQNRFYFRQVTRIKKRYISLEEYPVFKKLLEDILSRIRERVVFRLE